MRNFHFKAFGVKVLGFYSKRLRPKGIGVSSAERYELHFVISKASVSCYDVCNSWLPARIGTRPNGGAGRAGG